jgi:hypothetical protein
MTRQETIARHRLEVLASEQRGRSLLQLALRGIRTSGRGVTIGCWVKPGGGVAGCVFQHAYWQGVQEGAFEVGERASSEIKDVIPEQDFRLVMDAIRALDSLGKHNFMHRQGFHQELDEEAWRDTVQRLLVDALAATAPEPEAGTVPVPA